MTENLKIGYARHGYYIYRLDSNRYLIGKYLLADLQWYPLCSPITTGYFKTREEAEKTITMYHSQKEKTMTTVYTKGKKGDLDMKTGWLTQELIDDAVSSTKKCCKADLNSVKSDNREAKFSGCCKSFQEAIVYEDNLRYKVNDVIRFNYTGGSNPGCSRMVVVTNIIRGLIEGYDLDKKEPRNFSIDKMKDIMIINAEILTDKEMFGAFSTTSEHKAIFNKLIDCNRGWYEYGDKWVVYDNKPKNKYEITITDNTKYDIGVTLIIKHSNNELRLQIYSEEAAVCINDDNYLYTYSDTPDAFMKIIKDFIVNA